MKKFFSLVLALVMALSLTTVAWGATEYNVTSQAEWDTAIVAAGDGDTIKLAAGTYNLGEQGANLPANLTIIGSEGTIVTYFGVAAYKQCNVTIKNCTFKVGATDIGLSLAGKGTYVVENCDFVTDGDATRGSAIYMTALATDNKYTITGCSFDGKFREAAVVIQEQDNPTTFDVTVSGNDFSKMDAGLDVGVWFKDSSLNLDSDVAAATMVNSLAGLESAVANAEAGDIIALVGDVTVSTPIAIDKPITIDENGHSLSGLTAGAGVTTDASGKLTSGIFATAPAAADVADGYTVLKNTDGTTVVVPVVTFADKYDLYLADKTMNAMLALEKPAVSGLAFNEVGANTNLDGSGNVAYIVANNGEYYVKTTTPTTESYAVTYAGKTTVLYYVDVADVQNANAFAYAGSATAFDKFSTFDKCGYVTVAQMPAATDVYFQTAAGAALNVAYKAAATTGTDVTKNYLLDGEVVTVATTVPVVDHKFVASGYKYDTVKKINVPTSALCTKCLETSSVIYKDGKVPAGTKYYELWDGNNTTDYSVVATVAPVGGAVVTPSTDKVTSAETFDAGIAMYVGMSVMAAAGSAVVIGKKKD